MVCRMYHSIALNQKKTLCLFTHGHIQNPYLHCRGCGCRRQQSLAPSLRNFYICKANCYSCYVYAHQIRQEQNWSAARTEERTARMELEILQKQHTHAFVLIYGLPVFFFCNCTSRMHARTHAHVQNPARQQTKWKWFCCNQNHRIVFVCLCINVDFIFRCSFPLLFASLFLANLDTTVEVRFV